MQGPRDAMQHLAQQMGWLEQVLGEDFWSTVRSAAQAGSGPSVPVAEPPAAPQFPPVDLYVTPTEVVLSAAVPGLARPEQVAVSLAGPAELVLEGFLQPHSSLDLSLQRERFSGYFLRSLALPVPVDPAGAQAAYESGVLEIRFPRSVAASPGDDVHILQVPGGGKN